MLMRICLAKATRLFNCQAIKLSSNKPDPPEQSSRAAGELQMLLHSRSLNAILKTPVPINVLPNPLIELEFKRDRIRIYRNRKFMNVGLTFLATGIVAYFGGWMWAVIPAGFCVYQFVQLSLNLRLINQGVTKIILPTVRNTLIVVRYHQDRESR